MRRSPVLESIVSNVFVLAGVLFVLGAYLLHTGEGTIKPNPFFKPAIWILYAGIVALAFACVYLTPYHTLHQILRANGGFFLALFLVIILALIALYYTKESKESFRLIRRFLLEPSLFLVAVCLYVSMLNKKAKTIFLSAFCAVFLLHPILTSLDFFTTAISYAQKGLNPIFILGTYRAMPHLFFEASTGYAFFLIIALSIAIALFIATPYKKSCALVVALSLIACVLSGTRFLYVAMCVICLAPLVLLKYRYKAATIAISMAILVVFCVLLYHISANFSARFNMQNMVQNITQVLQLHPAAMGRFDKQCTSLNRCMKSSFPKDSHIQWEHSSLSRIAMSKSTVLAILDNPLRPNGFGLTLFGKNIVRIFGQDSEALPYFISIQPDGSILPYYWTNHNGILYLWFELGAIGFGLVVWLHLWLLLKARKIYYDTSTSPILRAFMLTIALMLIGLSVANFFDALPNRAGQNILFMFFGIFLAFVADKATKDKTESKTIRHSDV